SDLPHRPTRFPRATHRQLGRNARTCFFDVLRRPGLAVRLDAGTARIHEAAIDSLLDRVSHRVAARAARLRDALGSRASESLSDDRIEAVLRGTAGKSILRAIVRPRAEQSRPGRPR